jgi:hypothetical protein
LSRQKSFLNLTKSVKKELFWPQNYLFLRCLDFTLPKNHFHLLKCKKRVKLIYLLLLDSRCHSLLFLFNEDLDNCCYKLFLLYFQLILKHNLKNLIKILYLYKLHLKLNLKLQAIISLACLLTLSYFLLKGQKYTHYFLKLYLNLIKRKNFVKNFLLLILK